jgi:penicillin-binding protein 1A
VTVCADSGLLCSEACQADRRGSRAISVVVANGTAPTETCTMHTMVEYCTEGACLATEQCPHASKALTAILDYVRVDYGAGIVAEDDLYTRGGMEKAIGLIPTFAEDGTEIYPEVIGCPVHNAGGMDIPVVDPSDPNYVPEPPSTGDTPVQPDTPSVPDEPADPSGTEDWWGDLWNEPM